LSGFLLDTDIISELVARRPERRVTAWIEATDEILLHLSVLTLGEIRKGCGSRTAFSRFTKQLQIDGDSLPPNTKLQNSRLPVIDGLLAATALHYNLTLVTRNVKDVLATGIPLFNPWSP